VDGLQTEARLPAARDLDLLTTRQQVALFAAQDARAVEAVAAAGDAIASAVEAIADRLAAGGRLLYLGVGTPGRLAVLDAAECGPTFGVADRIIGVIAGGAAAVERAMEDLEDDAEQGASDLVAHTPTAHDAVVGISASGRTPYVIGGLRAARARGALTVALVANADGELAQISDLAIETLTGPEVLAGSTRLKAGTAQKLVLNTLSTLVMVRLGRTFGDLMVDVRPTNDKLRRRALRTVQEATGQGPAEAAAALAAADGEPKVAIVSSLAGIDSDQARQYLAAADGHVRTALAAAREDPAT
jgi:N-acetylmuramic acid 6-phosphate etherase